MGKETKPKGAEIPATPKARPGKVRYSLAMKPYSGNGVPDHIRIRDDGSYFGDSRHNTVVVDFATFDLADGGKRRTYKRSRAQLVLLLAQMCIRTGANPQLQAELYHDPDNSCDGLPEQQLRFDVGKAIEAITPKTKRRFLQ